MPQRRIAIAVRAAGCLIVAVGLVVGLGRSRGEEEPPQVRPRPEASGDSPRLPAPSAEAEMGFVAQHRDPLIPAASSGAKPAQRAVRAQPERPKAARQQTADSGPLSSPEKGEATPVPPQRGARSQSPHTPPSPAAPVASPGAADFGLTAPGQAQPGDSSPDAAAPQMPAGTEPANPPPAAASPPSALQQPVLVPPVPISLPPPRHPLPYRMVVDAPGLAGISRFEAVEARVRLRLLVRADGTVSSVDVAISSSRPELDAAAREAAQQWRFRPARRNGEPIDSVVLIWVSFVVIP